LIGFFVFCALYHVLQLAVVAAVKLTERVRGESAPPLPPIKHGLPFLAILALAPLALTLLAGVVGYRVTPLYVVPIFSLTPFLLLILVGANATRVVRATAVIYGVIVAGSLLIAPFLPALGLRMGGSIPPYQEISERAANVWKDTTSAPVHIVAGTWPYSEAMAFYVPGNVSEFTSFNFAWAPWISEDRIKRQGLLAVCLESDETCRAKALRFQTAGTRIVESVVSASRGQPDSAAALRFTIIATPPEPR
jgi:hypothetical protein